MFLPTDYVSNACRYITTLAFARNPVLKSNFYEENI